MARASYAKDNVPNWQINYGTGKDVSDETIQDSGYPMEIKWYNSSYVGIPVDKDSRNSAVLFLPKCS